MTPPVSSSSRRSPPRIITTTGCRPRNSNLAVIIGVLVLLLVMVPIQADVRPLFFPRTVSTGTFSILSEEYITSPGYIDLSPLQVTWNASTVPDLSITTTVHWLMVRSTDHTSCNTFAYCPLNWTQYGIGVLVANDNNTNSPGQQQQQKRRQVQEQPSSDVQFCSPEDPYDLYLDRTLFDGFHLAVTLDTPGQTQIDWATYTSVHRFTIASASGLYVVATTICSSTSTSATVTMSGALEFKSSYGYLPGRYVVLLVLDIIILVLYFVSAIWYIRAMCAHRETWSLTIERGVVLVLLLGLMEAVFQVAYLVRWNNTGHFQLSYRTVALITSALKEGILLSLIFLIALGRAKILCRVMFMGSLYVAATTTREALSTYMISKTRFRRSSIQVLRDLTVVIFVINLILVLWILWSFRVTYLYLRRVQQDGKVLRYLRLRNYFLLSAVISLVCEAIILTAYVRHSRGVWRRLPYFYVGQDLNYLFLTLVVACLWKPNPQAADYAYVMPETTDDSSTQFIRRGDSSLNGIVEGELELTVEDSTTKEGCSDREHEHGAMLSRPLQVDQGESA